MSFQKICSTAKQIVARLEAVKDKGEQVTRQALVLPLIESLGYDIWNPLEVCPEYEADFALIKQGQKEKVDFAVILNGIPRIFIEVKPYGTLLTGHEGQLARYFNSTPSVSLGILTDGVEYRFYTDYKEPNIMDPEPFHAVSLTKSETGLEVLTRFQKEIYCPEAIRDFAAELSYGAKITDLFKREIDIRQGDPSDSLVRWVLSSEKIYDGRITANVIDRFRDIIRKSLQRTLRDMVIRSFAALEDDFPTRQPIESTIGDIKESPQPEASTDNRGIVTTERELVSYAIIKRQFETSALAGKKIFDPGTRQAVPLEIGYKDTTAYFSVYLNKPTWWVARICIETRKPWIGFDLDPATVRHLVPETYEMMEPSSFAKTRVAINSPSDLHGLNQLLFVSFENIVAEYEQK